MGLYMGLPLLHVAVMSNIFLENKKIGKYWVIYQYVSVCKVLLIKFNSK